MNEYAIKVLWDAEVGVWVAESDDIPGLVTEAETMEELVRKIRDLVPELLELNHVIPDQSKKIHIYSERYEALVTGS